VELCESIIDAGNVKGRSTVSGGAVAVGKEGQMVVEKLGLHVIFSVLDDAASAEPPPWDRNVEDPGGTADRGCANLEAGAYCLYTSGNVAGLELHRLGDHHGKTFGVVGVGHLIAGCPLVEVVLCGGVAFRRLDDQYSWDH